MGSTTCSCSERFVLRLSSGAVCAGLDRGLERGLATGFAELAERRPRAESPAFPGRDAGERRFGSGLAATLFHLETEPGKSEITGIAGGVAEGLLDAPAM